jgi:hypothetical protein
LSDWPLEDEHAATAERARARRVTATVRQECVSI